ncbi:MAG: alanine racemase, partial [Patescibacteria group bacterium]|nr:alanine racemase [Patescibacteria group bacterium]
MKGFLRRLWRHRFLMYDPLISVTVSRGRLLSNLAAFQKSVGGRRIAPVLKSNAYGHGLFETAAVLELHDHIPFFVVDSYFEAVALRAKS